MMMIRLKSIVRQIFVIAHLPRAYDFLAHIKQNVFIACDRLSRRVRYARIIKRIRAYPPSRRIKVLFLVVNSAKWKAQTLFEAMQADGRFHPVMALTTDKEELRFNVDGAIHKLDIDRCFYEGLGNECVEAFDRENIKPQVVFWMSSACRILLNMLFAVTFRIQLRHLKCFGYIGYHFFMNFCIFKLRQQR